MKVMKGDYVTAVTQSTFAAFIGMVASITSSCSLFFEKAPTVFLCPCAVQQYNVNIATKELLVDTIKEAIPFIIVGSAVTIFKLVDQFTRFIKIMSATTEYSKAQLLDLFSIFKVQTPIS